MLKSDPAGGAIGMVVCANTIDEEPIYKDKALIKPKDFLIDLIISRFYLFVKG